MLLATLPAYEIEGTKAYAIIYRRNNLGQTEPCPFCGASHSHGPIDGHRVAHCVPMWKKGVTPNMVQPMNTIMYPQTGQIVDRKDGYIVRTVPEITDSIFNT